MLYIVLALVLAAFGLLIAALTTANTIWAWVSVTISVVAAGLLIADWVSTRRRADAASSATAAPATTRAPAGGPPRDRKSNFELVYDDPSPPEPPPSEPAVPATPPPPPEPLVEQTVQQAPVAVPPPDQEPAEEPTDAADLLVVSDLDVEVRVVDEHPRYHLATCAWLRDKPTLPLPVNEARQLGFTPCAYCGPDAVLAARHRAAR